MGLWSRWKRRQSTPWVLNYGDMTHVRNTEASYLTGAPTTGSSSFMGWASSNVLRHENRGAGAGSLALFEGQRTNIIRRSQELNNATWWGAFGTASATAGQDGPDGTTAERIQTLTGSNVWLQSPTYSAGWHAYSMWVRATSGTIDHRGYVYDGTVRHLGQSAISTTYQRLTSAASLSSGAGQFAAGSGDSGGGVSAGARDAYVVHAQVEEGRFASSVIRTTTSSFTRNADELTTTTFPSQLLTTPGRFSEVSPIFASADMVSGSPHAWLLSIDRPGAGDGYNGIRFRHTGSALVLDVVENNTAVVSSTSMSFGAHPLMGEVSWDPSAGTLTINGSTFTGTPWTWAGGVEVRVGGLVKANGYEAWSRLGELGSP